MDHELSNIEAQVKQSSEHENVGNFKKVNHPITLKFEDVVYGIKSDGRGRFFLLNKKSVKPDEKLILKGVSGIVCPGEILAMLGPSGSGKTTLLTALGGRLGAGGLGGSITYNTELYSSAIKRNIGFVSQDDILYPHLTVTETIVYTALLRLPNTMSKQEKISHAHGVITQLGLTTCKDVIIGGSMLKGISGGEKKRVSIGQEMIINPRLLLLDEPTSGLDSTTAQKIVSTLWDFANGGRTIVMSIHQPSSRLFYMFHKVLLLSEGNSLYYGKSENAMDYFASIGFAPSVAMNPSDFLLDLANGVSENESSDDTDEIKRTLVSAYKSDLEEIVKAELKGIDRCPQVIFDGKKQYKKWPTSWWEQFWVLLMRGLKERKHESFSNLKFVEVIIVALLAAFLWWKSDINHLQDQTSLFFFSATYWGFVPILEAIFAFPTEKLMLEKERSSGMYKLSSFFLARITSDLPMELALPTVFVFVTYFMGGLKRSLGSFLYYLFSQLLGVLVSQGLGLALGAALMDLKAATVLGMVIMNSSVLTGGYYVQNAPTSIAWLKYLSLTWHTYKLLLGSQYKIGETYPCQSSGDSNNETCLIDNFPTIKPVGLGGQLSSALALVIMMVGYRLIAYISLMRIGITKK
ncbi:hypothetical protein Leryth_019832 [Lithospermum erythrorhizon]|nr:hypothetical protein Leryth_019832 [Lithospermum erythrorhizon]